jgi:hypothetical protein
MEVEGIDCLAPFLRRRRRPQSVTFINFAAYLERRRTAPEVFALDDGKVDQVIVIGMVTF